MKCEYTIHNLMNLFLEHAKKAEEYRLKELEKFPEAEHLKDYFNISMALHCMCKELMRLDGCRE